MKFIVGIGNPGKIYEKTRHNVGFQILDNLNRKLYPGSSPKFKWDKDNRLKAEIKIYKGVSLAKPTTFVNLTGEAVSEIAKKNHCPPRDILVVCDDVNLIFGKLRLRESGSAGGHHGLDSIIGHLGSDEFPRLRIGVGSDKLPEDLAAFVLARFNADEQKELKIILKKAVLVCEAWIAEGFDSARNRLSQLQSIK